MLTKKNQQNKLFGVLAFGMNKQMSWFENGNCSFSSEAVDG